MTTYICEDGFDLEDRNAPGYSMSEVDYYAWIPVKFHDETPSHRLSLRKNLVSGKFEVYRRYHRPVTYGMVMAGRPVAVITTTDRGIEEIIFSGGFVETINYACDQYIKFHGYKDYERDEPCQHEYPKKSVICGKNRK